MSFRIFTEQRLKRNPSYASEHRDFLAEYENLDHMTKSLPTEIVKLDQYFISVHSRMPDGISMVRLSFKTGSPVDIDDSLSIATALYARKESRLRSQPEIRKQYNEFLREYHELKQHDDFLHEYCKLGHVELLTKGRILLFKPVYILLCILL